MLTINTTRFSTVIAAFVEHYPSATPYLNKRKVQLPIAQWCTNANLKSAIDFSLKEGEIELIGFHDGPTSMWACSDSLPLVEELASRNVLRFEVARFRNPGWFMRLFA